MLIQLFTNPVYPKIPPSQPDAHRAGFKDTYHGLRNQAYATDDLPDWFMKHTN